MNNKTSGKNASKIVSIVRTFTGTGTPKDWITTAIILLPVAMVLILVQFLIIYLIIMSPLVVVEEGIHKIAKWGEKVGNWFSNLGNWFAGHGFVDDETAFYEELKDQVDHYKSKGICIDDTLITATLLYKYMISSDPHSGNDENIDEDIQTNNTTEIDYDKAESKIKKLAKYQVYNNKLSNADYLAYLRRGKRATDEERTEMNNTQSSNTSQSGTSQNINIQNNQSITKYELTDAQIRGLANQCYKEQGSVEGAKAEASLMANRFEVSIGGNYNGDTGANGLYNYVKNSGWFANSTSNIVDDANPGQEYIDAVKDVLVNGNRTLPIYVTNHDCIVCYNDGTGDISYIENNGSPGDPYDRSQYISNVTKIRSRYQGDNEEMYIFYSFPTENSDPFSYLMSDVEKLGLSTSDIAGENSDAPVSSPINVEIINIPSGLGRYQTYTRWDDWNWVYGPGELIKKLGGQNYVGGGDVGYNDYGIVTYGQWFAAAFTEKFGEIGDMVFVFQDDGSVFPCIIADRKNSGDAGINEWGHNNGQNIVEFEIMGGTQAEKEGGNIAGPNGEFDHYKTKVVNIGNVDEHPEYINDVNGALKAANLSGVTFIDVGNIKTNGTNGNNYYSSSSNACPGNLEYFRPANEKIESENYKKGFLYNYYEDYFRNYDNDNQLNYSAENLIREIYLYKGSVTSIMTQTANTSSSTTGICEITGDFEDWKQYDSRWASIPLGNSSSTIKSAGCMVTSISILMRKSGTQINSDSFDPGVFVQTLNSNGGFTSSGAFTNDPNSWKNLAPNWDEVESNVPLTGNRTDKIKQLKEKLDQGYYLIVRTYHPTQHWIAINKIEGDTVYMYDPASNMTRLWDDGEYTVDQTDAYTSFKAIDGSSNTISSSGECAPASGEYKYYNQAAGDGSDGIHYGSYSPSCRSGTTLNEIGCSQMSIAIVASGLVSNDITPITVADAYCEVGINHAVNFSDIVQESLMQKLGLVATKLFSEGEDRNTMKQKLVDILSKGYPVIINVTNHFVAVIPGANGKIKLMDPGSIELTKEYSIDEFDKVTWHGSNLWRDAYYYSKRS